MTTLDELKKVFSKDNSIQVGDYKALEKFPTNLITLDRVLGGGLPMGRMMEIYGPAESGKTTFCMFILGQAMKSGLLCAYVDLELKLDVNSSLRRQDIPGEFLYKPTPYGEEAVNFGLQFIEAGGKVLVYDSLASLKPKSMYEADIEDNAAIGAQARFIGRAFALLADCAYKNDALIIFTNQIRTKMNGRMGACLPPNARVWLPDGSTLKMEDIVKDNMVGLEVLSINQKTHEVSAKPIEAVWDNGTTSEWLTIKTSLPSTLICTPEHHLLIGTEFFPAGRVTLKDKLCTAYPLMSERTEQVVTGLLLGGCQLEKLDNDGSLVFYDHVNQYYQDWKFEALQELGIRNNNVNGSVRYRSSRRADLGDLYKLFHVKQEGGHNSPSIPVSVLTPTMAVVWFYESYRKSDYIPTKFIDLNLTHLKKCVHATDEVKKALQLVKDFCSPYQDEVQFNVDTFHIHLENNAFKLFSSKVSGLFSDDSVLREWLHPEHVYRSTEQPSTEPRFTTKQAEIISITKNPTSTNKAKYDITVADNHTFFVGQFNPIAVHNSIDSPGGYAAKHQMILRLNIRRKEDLKNKAGDVYGIRSVIDMTKYQSTKSKREQFEIDVLNTGGISPLRVLRDELEYAGLIIRRGAWYSFEEEFAKEMEIEVKIGQGGDSVLALLGQSPELCDRLYERMITTPDV